MQRQFWLLPNQVAVDKFVAFEVEQSCRFQCPAIVAREGPQTGGSGFGQHVVIMPQKKRRLAAQLFGYGVETEPTKSARRMEADSAANGATASSA